MHRIVDSELSRPLFSRPCLLNLYKWKCFVLKIFKRSWWQLTYRDLVTTKFFKKRNSICHGVCFICCGEEIINKHLKIRLFRKLHKTLRGKCSQTDKNFTKLCEKIRRKSAVACFFSSKQLLKIDCISMRNYFI